MDIESVVRLVALLLAALMTGALMVNWIGLARAMSQMSSAAAYTEFHQATNWTFDPYMPSIGFGVIVGGIALAAFFSGGHSASGWLAITGTICYVLVIAISLSSNVPINKAKASRCVMAKKWRCTLAMPCSYRRLEYMKFAILEPSDCIR